MQKCDLVQWWLMQVIVLILRNDYLQVFTFFRSVGSMAWIGFRDWGDNGTYFWLSGNVVTTTGFSPSPWKTGMISEYMEYAVSCQ